MRYLRGILNKTYVRYVRRSFSELISTSWQKYNCLDFDQSRQELTHAPFIIGLEGIETGFHQNLRRIFKEIKPISPDNTNTEIGMLFGAVAGRAKPIFRAQFEFLKISKEFKKVYFCETGFICSINSWLLDGEGCNNTCMSYVIDDCSYYFISERFSRLNQILNSDSLLSNAQLRRSERVMKLIRNYEITKYNQSSSAKLQRRFPDKPAVLVCDQTFGDAAVFYGGLDGQAFIDMLHAAINENPDAEIFVKTHPDTNDRLKKRKRDGYLKNYDFPERVTLVTETINPYTLFAQVERVYVGTSLMGLEALIAGKKVSVFGKAFYAGWGLTDDRAHISHRHKTRSLSELFYYTYIWYALYTLPDRDGCVEIEEVIEFIVNSGSASQNHEY